MKTIADFVRSQGDVLLTLVAINVVLSCFNGIFWLVELAT